MATLRAHEVRGASRRRRVWRRGRDEPPKTLDALRVELLETEVKARQLRNTGYKLALFWACVFGVLTVLLVMHATYSSHPTPVALPIVTGPSSIATGAIAWVGGRRPRD